MIGRYLRAGVLLNGVLVKSEESTPQGGPLSALLANIYLDALDRELQNRGLRFATLSVTVTLMLAVKRRRGTCWRGLGTGSRNVCDWK